MTKKERIKLESMDLRQLREVEDQLCTAMRECSETLCSVRGEITMRIREKYADHSKEWFPVVCPGDVFRDTGERIARRRL